jgi:phosphoglycolate phosphatase/putative hydrolase of the HAD superfamily
MNTGLPSASVNWDRVRLVVFDVDGTLYNQSWLRMLMLLRLLKHSAQSRSLNTIRILHAFRRCREELGNASATDFATRQYRVAADQSGLPEETVRMTVEEWLDRQPLDILPTCRYAGVERVFAALSSQGKTVAVLSDYPAAEKLAALGLRADIIACASDPQVGALKPHPAGLRYILSRAQISPEATIMIGDRIDRDWAVAQTQGIRTLIRSSNPITGIDTFRGYRDEVFHALTEQPPAGRPLESS